jgi:hypothetical protein
LKGVIAPIGRLGTAAASPTLMGILYNVSGLPEADVCQLRFDITGKGHFADTQPPVSMLGHREMKGFVWPPIGLGAKPGQDSQLTLRVPQFSPLALSDPGL